MCSMLSGWQLREWPLDTDTSYWTGACCLMYDRTSWVVAAQYTYQLPAASLWQRRCALRSQRTLVASRMRRHSRRHAALRQQRTRQRQSSAASRPCTDHSRVLSCQHHTREAWQATRTASSQQIHFQKQCRLQRSMQCRRIRQISRRRQRSRGMRPAHLEPAMRERSDGMCPPRMRPPLCR